MKNGIVYVLHSLVDGKTYVGSIDNFERRLKQHNLGYVKSTKYRAPFKVLFTEQFLTLSEARIRELWWKSGVGRQKLGDYFRQQLR
jgi:putative endonuclease